MAKVRAGAGDKWQRRASLATDDYQTGVANPRTPWKQATIAAAKNQEDGVMQAIKDKRFESGVNAAGDQRWQDKTLSKGVDRYAPGVQLSQSDYETAVAPYTQVINNTQLPPRYPKGDPRNIARVSAIATALRNAKTKK